MPGTANSAVIISIDRLNALMLPPYGNTLIDTPCLNLLASESLVFDFAISESPDELGGLNSIWLGSHPLYKQSSHDGHITTLAYANVHTTLLTDSATVAESEAGSQFARVINIETPNAEELAASPAETWMANFFAQALQAIERMEAGELLWIHCNGLAGPWDAPMDFRASLADPEDPPPLVSSIPPIGTYDVGEDSPDKLLGFHQACLGQVMLIDEFLGVLMDAIRNRPDTLLGLLSTRGYPLGEHGTIGDPLNLHCESVHVPLMIRYPEHQLTAARMPQLQSVRILGDALAAWFSDDQAALNSSSGRHHLDSFVVSTLDESIAIQTTAWKLIRDANQSRLYAKPDDRWEVNDVIDRCPQIAPLIEALLDEAITQLKSSGSSDLRINDELKAN